MCFSQNKGNGTEFLEVLADTDDLKTVEDSQMIIYSKNDMIQAILETASEVKKTDLFGFW